MVVYRVCSKEEVDFLLNGGDISLVGSMPEKFRMNIHCYDVNERYMHFFRNEGNVVLVGRFPEDYICVYDIPKSVLRSSIGIGYYTNIFSTWELTEYAIRSKDMNFGYLKRVKIAKDSLYINFLMDHIPWYLTEVIYDRDEPKIGGR